MGDWQGSDPPSTATLAISPLSSNSYTFLFTALDSETKRKTTMEFEAHVFRFQNETYVDILPRKFQVKGKNEQHASTDDDPEFYVPAHTAMRLTRDKDNLSFFFRVEFEGAPLFKTEDEQARKAREEKEQRKRTALLTMSTEQLQREVLASLAEDESSGTASFHRGKLVLPD